MPDLSTVLNVVIGLVFVFLLFSLLASWVQEFIAGWLDLRSKHLANFIQNLLDPSVEKLDGVKRLEADWSTVANFPGPHGLKRFDASILTRLLPTELQKLSSTDLGSAMKAAFSKLPPKALLTLDDVNLLWPPGPPAVPKRHHFVEVLLGSKQRKDVPTNRPNLDNAFAGLDLKDQAAFLAAALSKLEPAGQDAILSEWISPLPVGVQKKLKTAVRDPKAVAEAITKCLLTPPMDAKAALKENIVKAFYEHPVINGLSRPNERPSYISSRDFSSALFDLVKQAAPAATSVELKQLAQRVDPNEKVQCALLKAAASRTDLSLGGLSAAITDLSRQAAATSSSTIQDLRSEIAPLAASATQSTQLALVDAFANVSSINAGGFRDALDKLIPMVNAAIGAAPNDFQQLRQQVEQLPNEAVRQALLTQLDAAAATATKAELQVAVARKNVEAWFDSAMDRAEGWYKRDALQILIAIGIVLAIAFNVDTIALARTLWTDPALRASVTAAAAAYVQTHDQSSITSSNTLSTTSSITGSNTLSTTVQDVRKELDGIGLPIGWNQPTIGPNAPDPFGWPLDIHSPGVFAWGVFLKLLGWLITGFAISRGAPVWFDFLGKLVNMRETGAKPG